MVWTKFLGCLAMASVIATAIACSKKAEPPPEPVSSATAQVTATPSAAEQPSAAPVASVEPEGSAAAAEGKSGSIKADPNPIKICNNKSTDKVKISWEAKGTSFTQVRIGTPDGPLFLGDGPKGTSPTGPWVGEGTTFYLQDGSSKTPTLPSYTLAKVVISAVREPCP